MIIIALFKTLGRLALLAATAAFLTGVSLLILGSYLMTWPVLRKSPRNQRLSATIDMATAGLALLAAYGRAPAE